MRFLSDLSARTETTENDSISTQSIGPIPRGPFVVPIQLPQQQNSACLARTNESISWQCASDTTFQLNVLPPPSDSNATMITLGSVPSTNGTIYHGHQAPDVSPVQLKLLDDRPETDGPVYYFRTTYNRVVLLKDNDLMPADGRKPQPAIRHPAFQPGESLWRCVFNETLIEGYMYPNQKIAPSGTPNTTATAMKTLPKIPYVLKLVEQRMPNGKVPYCEKVKLEDGSLSRLPGEKVVLKLAEPAAEAAAKAALVRSSKFRVRQQAPDSSYCRCLWMVQ
jgi:hypothetical protein